MTGGATGIGLATALGLAADGYRIVIASRRADLGAEAVNRIRALGGAASHAAIDIRDTAAVDAMISPLPRVDALVNCVGAFHIGPFESTSAETWRTLIATNVTALWSLCRRTLPKMRAGSGIVNVSSRGYLGSPQLSAYGASKAAVVGLTRALALELVPRRIAVNAVAPGMIDTPLLRTSLDKAGFAAAKAQQPGGHIGRPEDVAAAVRYFLRASPFATGQVLCVDGGKSVTSAFVG